MKRTLLNPTIFAYTLYVKFADWRNCIPLLLVMLIPSFNLAITMLFPHSTFSENDQKMLIRGIKSFFFDSTIGLIGAYLFISDGLASRKLIADAEPLTLTFTRPVTRFCYIISKFCGATTGVAILFSLGYALALLVAICFGIKLAPASWLDFLSIFCNAASFSALVTMLHSARPPQAILLYVSLIGASGMAATFTTLAKPDNELLQTLKTICIFIGNNFGDLDPQSLDLAALLSASFLDTYELVIYSSNIAILLLLGSLALCKREFSYGAD